jgi:predicted GNAT superfamily acetyltransferase
MLAVRRTSPALARRWRLAVRGALGGAISNGYKVTGVLPAGWYVLEKAQAPG